MQHTRAQGTEARDDRGEAQYQRLLDSLTDAMLVHDAEQVRFANRAAAALIGMDSAALVGTPVAALVDPASLDVVRRILRAPDAPAEAQHLAATLVRTDGATLAASVTVHPLEWDGAAAVLMVCAPAGASVAGPVARPALETPAELRQRQRLEALGTLAAGVAHEINNPLTYVLANLDVMFHMVTDGVTEGGEGGGAPLDREEMRELLVEAMEGADRVRRVVGELRSFSRKRSDKITMLHVRRPLESSVRIARHEIQYRARLVEDYGEVPRVLADEARLGQVFVNLLVNAAQSIPAGDVESNEIRVHTWHDPEGSVVIDISDTGCGIDADMCDRIFDPFVTSKSLEAGTGLGLTISYNIIDSLGGTLSVDSEVGVGSTFRIRLPVLTDTREATPTGLEIVEPTRVPRARILVVDDEQSVRRLLCRVLGEHEVTAVASGRDAVARLASDSFDMVLCDLIMPQQTGLDVYEAMQRLHPGKEMCIVFMTGGAFTPWAHEFLASVPNRRVEKPFDIATIRRVVADVLLVQRASL